MTDLERFKAMRMNLSKLLHDSKERIIGMEEVCHKIEVDLDSTMPEFVETTGKQPYAYYGWRRRAKLALFYKRHETEREQRHCNDLKVEDHQLEMIIKAFESGYRGEDEYQLLRAMLHLANDIITEVNYVVDDEQDGLLSCVSHRLGNLDSVKPVAKEVRRPSP